MEDFNEKSKVNWQSKALHGKIVLIREQCNRGFNFPVMCFGGYIL